MKWARLAFILGTTFAAGMSSADDKLPNVTSLLASRGIVMTDAIKESHLNDTKCTRSEQNCDAGAPTPRKLAYDERSCGGGTLIFGWRLSTSLVDGVQFIQRVEKDVEERNVFDCRRETCLAIVPTVFGRERDPAVRTYSVCQVPKVGDTYGPPENCKELLKSSREVTVINSVVGHGEVACAMGMPDFDVKFNRRDSDLTIVRTFAKDTLAHKPFNLNVSEQNGDRGTVFGVRSYLPSELFSGWREWTTVRVEIVQFGENIEVTISTNILVSKQNTTERDSWTPASEQQQATYVTALRNALVKRGGTIGTGRAP